MSNEIVAAKDTLNEINDTINEITSDFNARRANTQSHTRKLLQLFSTPSHVIEKQRIRINRQYASDLDKFSKRFEKSNLRLNKLCNKLKVQLEEVLAVQDANVDFELEEFRSLIVVMKNTEDDLVKTGQTLEDVSNTLSDTRGFPKAARSAMKRASKVNDQLIHELHLWSSQLEKLANLAKEVEYKYLTNCK